MITTTDTGLKQLDAKIKRFSLSKVADIVDAGYKKKLMTSTNADGSGMTPLTTRTIKEKFNIGARFPRKPLVRTEQLINSVDKRKLNPFTWVISIMDKVRGKSSNTRLLDYGKERNRSPWGLQGSIAKIREYANSIFTAK